MSSPRGRFANKASNTDRQIRTARARCRGARSALWSTRCDGWRCAAGRERLRNLRATLDASAAVREMVIAACRVAWFAPSHQAALFSRWRGILLAPMEHRHTRRTAESDPSHGRPSDPRGPHDPAATGDSPRSHIRRGNPGVLRADFGKFVGRPRAGDRQADVEMPLIPRADSPRADNCRDMRRAAQAMPPGRSCPIDTWQNHCGAM
jgi:hypothetical protein